MNHKKAMLVILDGWGLGQDAERDAVSQAHTPFFDQILHDYPSSTLVTHGDLVGLPAGQMGNSEVGHLNIGAGRIVYQELARINKAIVEDTLKDTEAIQSLISYSKVHKKPVHLMGLLSDGGVHAHIDHMVALCKILSAANVEKVYLHLFMDGRDTDPHGGAGYIQELQRGIQGTSATIATVIGRYYAMDRDERWERIKESYDLLVQGTGLVYTDPVAAMNEYYAQDITDEFIPATLIDPKGCIVAGDAVLFINFRTDRPRQLVRALTQEDFAEQDMQKMSLHMTTMTEYNAHFENVHIVYSKENLEETLGEVISKAGLTQVRIAETEKYPHVTFFFNGGREEPLEGEERIVIASPKVATYDLQPEMSAIEVTDSIISKINADAPDFICLNYANADMVGHTGDFAAAMKACETVDTCLSRLVDTALTKHYEMIVIADHGNADIMRNEDGSAHTAHTTNLVPVVYLSAAPVTTEISSGKLADVAPTILRLMGVAQPEAMTGESLLS